MSASYLAIDTLSRCVGYAYQNKIHPWDTEESDGFAGLCSDCIDFVTRLPSDKIEGDHDPDPLDGFKKMLDAITSFLGDISNVTTDSSELNHTDWNVEHLCGCICRLVEGHPSLVPDVHRCATAFLALYVSLEGLDELCNVCGISIPEDHPSHRISPQHDSDSLPSPGPGTIPAEDE